MSNANDADSVASSITRINVCLWVLYSWCRDGGNLEAAYLSSEQALLLAWDKAKEHYTGRNKASKSFDSILETYQQITDCYVDQCLIPYVGLKYAISHAVQSPSSIDVNIKLFDVLGRLSVKGHWVLDALIKSYTATPPTDGENQEQELLRLRLREITKSINLLVVNNPLLLSPYKDSQAIDLALTLTLLSNNSELDEFVKSWLSELVNMCMFAFGSNGMYPIVHNSFEKLLEHQNKDRADGNYKNKVTEASILYPLLAVFCSLYELNSVSQELEKFATDKLAHCTLQYWYPNEYSEKFMYSNSGMHGPASTNFPMNSDLALEHIAQECDSSDSFKKMSAAVEGKLPLLLTACRCYRYPAPFHFVEGFVEDIFKQT